MISADIQHQKDLSFTHCNSSITILQNWSCYTETFNNYRTRGGPITLNPAGYEVTLSLSSDSRKDWVAGVGAGTYRFNPSYDWFAEASLELRLLPNISFIINPIYQITFEFAQYVDTYTDVTAHNVGCNILGDQKTLSSSIRLNWTFTPNLSLQLYVQPLISAGDYTNYKELSAPGTYDFIKYGEEGSTFDPESNTADPDGEGPAQPIQIDNPDFNVKSLRGNAVLRWEYFVVYFVQLKQIKAEKLVISNLKSIQGWCC
jgi:hypothetical protein